MEVKSVSIGAASRNDSNEKGSGKQTRVEMPTPIANGSQLAQGVDAKGFEKQLEGVTQELVAKNIGRA